jgi:hypothetical protein
MPSKYKIFISYRRRDSQGKESGTNVARAIKQRLQLSGYDEDVFFDYSEMTNEDFEQKILTTIKGASVFICVVTRDSLQRCVSPTDWVRREILQAKSCGLKMVFVTPDGDFCDDFPVDFPSELDFMRSVPIIPISMNANFENDMAELVENEIEPNVRYCGMSETMVGILCCLLIIFSIVLGICVVWWAGVVFFFGGVIVMSELHIV